MIVSVIIDQIKFSPVTQSYVITLKELSGIRTVNIVIGPFEAQAIAFALDKVPIQRPLTHDLLKQVILALNGKIKKTTISKLEGNTYFANLEMELPNNLIINIDSRPSDAIALAIRMNIPILVNDSILGMNESEDAMQFMISQEQEEMHVSLSESERLQKELDQAISQENYEKAALLRDKLKEISKEHNS